MSTTTISRASFGWTAILATLGAATVAIAIPVYALMTASGVTSLGDDAYDTEFITLAWSWVWLLVLVPGVVVWFRPRLAALLGVIVVVPQVVAAAVTVGRYQAAGWGDGLEVLSFLIPFGMAAIIVVELGVAAAVRRARGPR